MLSWPWISTKKHKQELNKRELEVLLHWLQALIPIVEQKTRSLRTEIDQFAHLVKRILQHYPNELVTDWEIYLLSTLVFTSKITIPDYIFSKQEKISPFEAEAIRDHIYFAKEMLVRSQILVNVRDAFFHHHERFDGLGYPSNKAGEDIPQLARIVHVVESYISMTSPRSYRESLQPEEAFWELQKERDSVYDPKVIEILGRELGMDRGEENNNGYQLYNVNDIKQIS